MKGRDETISFLLYGDEYGIEWNEDKGEIRVLKNGGVYAVFFSKGDPIDAFRQAVKTLRYVAAKPAPRLEDEP
jgi:hypothetical protein